MANNQYTIGSITLVSPTSSRMYGNYLVYGSGENNRTFSITVKETTDLNSVISSKAKESIDVESKIDIREHVNMSSTITVKQASYSDLGARMTVAPKRTMWGRYEVIEPIPIVTNIYGSKDTYNRSNRPRVNYGSEEYLLVGNNYGDMFETFIRYDISSIPSDREIKKVEIVFQGLEYGNPIPLKVSNVMEDWNEYSTTWVNKPSVGEPSIRTMSNTGGGEYKLNITDIFNEWYTTGINEGVHIALDDLSVLGTKTFGSREALNEYTRHYLRVEYLDPAVFSFNNTYTRARLEVRPIVDIVGKIEARPTSWDLDVKGVLHAVRGDSLESIIRVSQPNIYSKMVVKYARDIDLPTKVTVFHYNDDDSLGGNIEVLELHNSITGKIDVKNYFDLPSSIESRAMSDRDLKSKVTVHNVLDSLHGIVSVPGIGFLKGTVGVKGVANTDTNAIITVHNTHNLIGSIYVRDMLDITGKLVVYRTNVRSMRGKITVHEVSDLHGKIRVIDYHDLQGSITSIITDMKDTSVKLTVHEIEDLVGRIFVESYHDLDSVIVTRVDGESSTNGTITVTEFVNLDGFVTVREEAIYDGLYSEITARVDGYIDLISSMIVRARDDDSLVAIIQVNRQGRRAYVFIM